MNLQEALATLQKTLPDYARVGTGVQYNDLFLFQVFTPDPAEGNLDPFRSVNSRTGEVANFSIFSGGNTIAILDLFEAAQKKEQ